LAMLVYAFDSYPQVKELWAIDLATKKSKLIPKKHYETYFRVNLDKYPVIQPKDSIFLFLKEFVPDSGYIGGIFTYESIRNDSLILAISHHSSLAPELNYRSEYQLSIQDITQIHLQQTYIKATENIWVYGGVVGVLSLLVSPVIYFTESKPIGSGLFAFGSLATAASIVSYKIHFGYRKFGRSKYEFVIR
jgi:hypothetical protein